eukprot:749654-Hanusia_phi.AAC.2
MIRSDLSECRGGRAAPRPGAGTRTRTRRVPSPSIGRWPGGCPGPGRGRDRTACGRPPGAVPSDRDSVTPRLSQCAIMIGAAGRPRPGG